MYLAGDLTKSSKWELLHLKEVPYWHKAGSGIQEVFNRMHKAQKDLDEMDTETIEVWVSTLLALAMQHSEKKTFWLGKPKNDPPDMAVMTITETGRFHAREIEVTRCISPDKELIDNILKKDRQNKLSDKYILCALIEIPGEYDLIKIGKDLVTKLSNIKNVFIVFHGAALSDFHPEADIATKQNLWTVAQLTPLFDAITLDITTEYQNWLSDPDKLRYVKDSKIFAGKKNPNDPYPTILPDTPLQVT